MRLTKLYWIWNSCRKKYMCEGSLASLVGWFSQE